MRSISVAIINTIIISVLATGIIHAGTPVKNDDQAQWLITGRIGTGWLLKEITTDFIILDNEFNHTPGLAIDLSLSRTYGEKWEPGIMLSIYSLTGESDLPLFSANNFHSAFSNLYQAPVKYITVSTSLSAYCRYYPIKHSKKNTKQIRLNPYVELGTGINYFFTEVGYKTTPSGTTSPVIFQKGTGEKPRTHPGNVAEISLGLGTKIELPSDLNMILGLNTDIVNYDCLDAVHNYYEDGERTHAKGIVPRIMIGVVVPISNKSRSGSSHLPWGP